MNCKGIWYNQGCPSKAKAENGQDYCADCWEAGEDIIREKDGKPAYLYSQGDPCQGCGKIIDTNFQRCPECGEIWFEI